MSNSLKLNLVNKITVFEGNVDFDSTYFRIPFCEVTNNDVLICGSDVRYDGPSDVGNINIGIARSFDQGSTWTDKQIVMTNHRLVDNSRIIDACILVDRKINRVLLFGHCIDSNHLWEQTHIPGNINAYMVYKYSDDDGETWSEEISLEHLKDDTMVTFFPAPGKGITMEDGTLVAPCQIKTNNEATSIQSCVMVSYDHGLNWEFKGGRIPSLSSECQVVEYESGKLMLNCRSYYGYRRVYISDDLGATWLPHETNVNTLIEPYACQGSLDLVDLNGKKIYVFCNPHSSKARENIAVQVSEDAINWEKVITLVEEETDGYTCLCHKDNIVYVAVERKKDLELYKLELNS